MLEKLFTSRTRVGILKLFLFRPDEEFHLRDIAKRVGVTPIYASKELSNLSKLRIVSGKKKANLVLYSLDKDCPILDELRRMFLKTDYLGESVIKEFADSRYCFIYGSFARGEESRPSDIDLFIVSEMSHEEMLRRVQRLQKRVDREINPVLWDDKAFAEKKHGSFMETVLSGGILMLIGDENELRRTVGQNTA